MHSLAKKHDLLTDSGTEILEPAYIHSDGKIVNEEVSEKMINILSLIQKAGVTLLRDFRGSIGDYYTKV